MQPCTDQLHLCVIITIVLFGASVTEGLTPGRDRQRPAPLWKNFPKKYHQQVYSECKKIKNNTWLYKACTEVARNPMIMGMGSSAAGFIGHEERLEYFRNTLGFGRGLGFQGQIVTQTICSTREKCPNLATGTENIKSNLLSLSPWTMCQEYDPMRYPQWLNIASCLCKGCIDHRTGKESIGNVISTPISVAINVIRKKTPRFITFNECTMKTCEQTIHDIVVGCHCIYPRRVG